jgi:hypothetical protein
VGKQRPDSNPIWKQFGPFQNEKGENDLKRVWNLTPFFQHGLKWESRGQVPNLFGTSQAFSKTNTTKTISKGFGT